MWSVSLTSVTILSICYGIILGWTSPALYFLTSDKSPLPSGPISMAQASWIASLLAIGGLIGTMFFGYVASKYGRKGPLLFISIPMIVRHFIWTFSTSTIHSMRSFIQFILDLMASRLVCEKCLLVLCRPIVARFHLRWCCGGGASLFTWNIQW